jgi:membrane-anchored protein YejM (alkaline phosphatase superfamily)
MDSITPIPENSPKFADIIVEQANEISNVDLDFSPESLREVDAIIENFKREKQNPDSISSTLFCFGCYVGEVFVRNSGGEWRRAAEFPQLPTNAPMVVRLPSGMIVNPIDKIVKRLINGEVDSIVYFYNVFTQEKE